jgi:cytochrome c biogenesis protein CcdA
MIGISSLAGAFIAGVLTTLSPCVLPILPIVLGAAASESRYGPAALAAGLAASFVVIGLFVATLGYSVGLTADLFRQIAAALMIVLGAALLLPRLQGRLAMASAPVANWTDRRFGTQRGGGYAGQFALGLILGAVWSPCVGPTLGAASLLAAQGRQLPQVAASMFVFGLGATLPLLAVGLLSREALQRWRTRILSAGQIVKLGFGTLLIVFGALVLTGLDKRVETGLVNASPQWLTDLTTRF